MNRPLRHYDDRTAPSELPPPEAAPRAGPAMTPRDYGSGYGPVGLSDREGVFAHSFKCLKCKLEFVIYSWRAGRHRAGEIWCPECGERTPMRHRRACLNESRAYTRTAREIHHLTTFPGSVLVDEDETPAAEPPDTHQIEARWQEE